MEIVYILIGIAIGYCLSRWITSKRTRQARLNVRGKPGERTEAQGGGPTNPTGPV